MAKQSQSRQQRRNAQLEQQKTPNFLGAIWGSIKGFFQNIVNKIKDVMEYATRLKNGKKDWENSIEGKAAPKDLTFKPSDQIAEEQIHFPGFHDMTMSNGMVRIPAGTENIWPVEDKQRYLNALNEKFGSIPNPLETQNGAFITDISHNIQRCIKKGINGLSIYGVGNAIITTEIQGSKCKINVSNGTQERSLITSTPKEMRNALASLYSSVVGKEDDDYRLNDKENNITYITRKAQDGEFYTFSAEPHKRHIFNLDTQVRFVVENANIDSIMEVQGPALLEKNIIDTIVPVATAMSKADQHQMATAMHEVMVDNAPKQKGDSVTIQNNPSMYVTQDKVFWLTAEDDHFMLNVAPVRCPYSNIISHVPISAEACEPTNDAHSMINKAISKGARDIDKKIIKRIEHPKLADLPILALQALNGMECGMPVVEIETKTHNLKFEGYNYALPDGPTHRDVSISLDGTLLYGKCVVGNTPEEANIVNAGTCNTMKDAFQKICDIIRNQQMTRVEQEAPEEFKNDINQDAPVHDDGDER